MTRKVKLSKNNYGENECKKTCSNMKIPKYENLYKGINKIIKHNKSNRFYDNSIFIQNIPLKIDRKKILNNLKKIKGFVSLTISEPIKGRNHIQYGWVKFK